MRRSDNGHLAQLWESIASLPSLVVGVVLAFSAWQLTNFTGTGTPPEWMVAINITNPDTARSLLAAVVGGVFTLTVFSYTMVMTVMNRSIASYTPRYLPHILSLRFHQWLLGASVATISHALLMLLALDDDPASVPFLAGPLSGLFAVVCLLSFVYYIHAVSQTLHANKLLFDNFDRTRRRIQELVVEHNPNGVTGKMNHRLRHDGHPGYLVGVDVDHLLALADKENLNLVLVVRPGAFVGYDAELFHASAAVPERARKCLTFSAEVPIGMYASGFKHLCEVAVKACSPALNDPGTALLALNYLGELFVLLGRKGPTDPITRLRGRGSLTYRSWTVDDLADFCLPELDRYLSGDPWTANALVRLRRRIGVARGGDLNREEAAV